MIRNIRLGFGFVSAGRAGLKRSGMRLHSTIASEFVPSESKFIRVEGSTSTMGDGKVIIVPLFKGSGDDVVNIQHLDAAVRALVDSAVKNEQFKGESESKFVLGLNSTDAMSSCRYVALVGLGDATAVGSKKGKADLDIHLPARIGRSAASIANELRVSSVDIIMPSELGALGAKNFVLALQDACYHDNRFRLKAAVGGASGSVLSTVRVLGCSQEATTMISDVTEEAAKISSGIKFAKDLVGAPANIKTPLAISALARRMSREHDMSFTLLGAEECAARKMGGYLGVQQGSKFPPQFVHIAYTPKNPSGPVRKVALVGKGLTFDSGGYNLKVGSSQIEMMKVDMGGCAAVLGCAKAIGQLQPQNCEVHFITALCENMINEHAMRPGDVLEASNGKTIEVINTDAEGRLTLADALVYAESLGVEEVVDLATLTGACVVALGEEIAAVYSTDDDLAAALLESSKRTPDKLWRMPLETAYYKTIKGSDIADIANAGDRWGGSITAALFLKEFVTDKVKWAHIDMAGPVWDGARKQPTGFGVRLLTDFLLKDSAPK